MTPEQRSIYAILHCDRAHHETVARDLLTPLAAEIRHLPELESLFFVRLSVPDWQLRLRVVGEAGWPGGGCRELLERHLEPLRRAGVVTAVEYTRYQREVERYGGEEGMALAEELYLHDSLACLDFMAAEDAGELGRGRRELALLLGERFCDLLRFDAGERDDFYRFAYQWATAMDTWNEADYETLERRYQRLRPGLATLLGGEMEDEELWGGAAGAAIAGRLLAAAAPVLARVREGWEAGRVTQSLPYLAWSYTHLFCNRLGIDPAGEAVLRYIAHRFRQDRRRDDG